MQIISKRRSVFSGSETGVEAGSQGMSASTSAITRRLKQRLQDSGIFDDPITLSPLIDPVSLTACGHTFSEQSIAPMLDRPSPLRCPLCREPAPQSALPYVRNYLAQDLMQLLAVELNRPIAPHIVNAAARGDITRVRILLDQGVNPDCIISSDPHRGTTALYMAAQHGHLDVVDLLLRHGARIDAYKHATRATPLHAAATQGHREVAAMLLQKGGDIGAKTSEGLTAMGCAVVQGHVEVVKLLLRYGSAVNDPQGTGGDWTLLELASRCRHTSILSLLVAAGERPSAQTGP